MYNFTDAALPQEAPWNVIEENDLFEIALTLDLRDHWVVLVAPAKIGMELPEIAAMSPLGKVTGRPYPGGGVEFPVGTHMLGEWKVTVGDRHFHFGLAEVNAK